MTGLDKILAEIKSDSDKNCLSVKNETDVRCEAIINEAKLKAQNIASDADKKAEDVYEDIIKRAKSLSLLESRALILKTKQEIISQSLEQARIYLCNLPSDEYFSLIYKMIEKHSEKSEGEICFSKKDLDRLPTDFEQKLKFCSNGNLVLSETPIDIDGGFILVYGLVEVNCAFSSVFMAESDPFSDEASKLLFS